MLNMNRSMKNIEDIIIEPNLKKVFNLIDDYTGVVDDLVEQDEDETSVTFDEEASGLANSSILLPYQRQAKNIKSSFFAVSRGVYVKQESDSQEFQLPRRWDHFSLSHNLQSDDNIQPDDTTNEWAFKPVYYWNNLTCLLEEFKQEYREFGDFLADDYPRNKVLRLFHKTATYSYNDCELEITPRGTLKQKLFFDSKNLLLVVELLFPKEIDAPDAVFSLFKGKQMETNGFGSCHEVFSAIDDIEEL